MLGGCLLVQAVGLALAVAAPSTLLFFLALIVVGLAMGAGDPATNVLVSTNVSQHRRGMLMGVKQTGLTIGGLLGGLVLPSLAEATSWRVAVAAPIAVGVVVALFGIAVAGPVLARCARVADPVRATSLFGIGIYGLIMAGIQASVLSYLAVYLVDQEDVTATTAGLAIAVALAGATVGRIVWGMISDRLLHSRLLALQFAALGAAVALGVLSIAGASALLWPDLFLLGFCAVGWNTVYVTVAAESVPPSMVGKATGEALFFSYAGCVAMPPLLGVIHDGTSSWLVTWLAAAAVTLAALVVCRGWASRTRD